MTALVLASFVDATAVLALGLAATALLRRRSAALRHAVVATTMLTAALMPIFELVLPPLPVIHWMSSGSAFSSGVVFVSGSADGQAIDAAAASGAAPGLPWTTMLAVVWMLGAAAIVAGLATGLVRLARLRRRCTPVTGRWRELTDELSDTCGVRRNVTLLQSDDPSLLVTCGVLRPEIILPAGASTWTDERSRSVLRHELAHVRRHDAAIQLAAEALRAVLWVNPLAWMACRRLRQESEIACDDAVLDGGVDPADYASQLLAVARQLSHDHRAWASMPAIAEPSTLEKRIVAMLHRHQDRTPVSRRDWLVAALVALAVGIPLAAAGVAPVESTTVATAGPRDVSLDAAGASLPATAPVAPGAARPVAANPRRQTPSTVSGRVIDPSGGALPGTNLTLTDMQSDVKFAAVTNAAGQFAFRDVPSGRYRLVATLPGFAAVANVIALDAGAAVGRTITLPLGRVQETITVACGSAPAPVARLEQAAMRVATGLAQATLAFYPTVSAQELATPIRVGGSIQPPRKLKDVRPKCPPVAPSVATTVQLAGRIGVDGMMSDVATVPAEGGIEPPSELVESALEAVRQWLFSPTLLNGQPVETNITVRVVFTK